MNTVISARSLISLWKYILKLHVDFKVCLHIFHSTVQSDWLQSYQHTNGIFIEIGGNRWNYHSTTKGAWYPRGAERRSELGYSAKQWWPRQHGELGERHKVTGKEACVFTVRSFATGLLQADTGEGPALQQRWCVNVKEDRMRASLHTVQRS